MFCRATVKGWNKTSGELKIKIEEYNIGIHSNFSAQQPKQAIQQLVLESIHWPTWESHLSSYKKQSFADIELIETALTSVPETPNTIHLSIKANLKDVRLRNGYAIVSKKFNWSEETVEIRIQQPHLLREYDYIKPFFAAYWKKKTIGVKATIVLLGKKVKSARGTSSELESIDKRLIDVIKLKQFKKHLEEPFIKIIDKSLFTMDDLFNEEYASDKGNLTPTDFNELFSLFLGENHVRNAPQLQYLAGKLHQATDKIRITLTPNFGFIFHVAGELRDHYIWELLDSHATYIWSFDHSLSSPEQLEILSSIIASINLKGRQLYRLAASERENTVFNLVNHAAANSSIKDHFPKWKLKVEELLV